MRYVRNSRRDFLRNLACVVCSGTASALVPQLRMMGTALASTPSLSGYKALVCVYLAGGNDSWNMLVPQDSTRYATYSTSRGGVYNPATNPGGLALANPTAGDPQILTDGNDGNSSTNKYFMHPSLTNLATIYKQNKLAFAVNMGTLVQPINRIDYDNAAPRPPQLFSHADQENLWHQANTNASSNLGWGGQCADNLFANGANTQVPTDPQLSLCVSVSGANRFEVGNTIVPYQMSSSGLTKLNGFCNPCTGGSNNNSLRDSALKDMLAQTNATNPITYANDFAAEYQAVFKRGRDLFNMLNPSLPGPGFGSVTFPNTSLGNQLKVVAEMIQLSKANRYASRQIYYVRLGGFDMHSGLMSSNAASTTDHAGLLTQVDQALNAFWLAMGTLPASPGDTGTAQNEVTAFTASEFARTLQSNGAGSDHGWGGIQMALGGAVNGGKLYSNGQNPKISGFPNEALNAPNNFSRGQIIPGISVDQYAATLATWLGVGAGNLTTIFPNLANFGTSNLGFI